MTLYYFSLLFYCVSCLIQSRIVRDSGDVCMYQSGVALQWQWRSWTFSQTPLPPPPPWPAQPAGEGGEGEKRGRGRGRRGRGRGRGREEGAKFLESLSQCPMRHGHTRDRCFPIIFSWEWHTTIANVHVYMPNIFLYDYTVNRECMYVCMYVCSAPLGLWGWLSSSPPSPPPDLWTSLSPLSPVQEKQQKATFFTGTCANFAKASEIAFTLHIRDYTSMFINLLYTIHNTVGNFIQWQYIKLLIFTVNFATNIFARFCNKFVEKKKRYCSRCWPEIFYLWLSQSRHSVHWQSWTEQSSGLPLDGERERINTSTVTPEDHLHCILQLYSQGIQNHWKLCPPPPQTC